MSVYIRGMEMPKSCSECAFCGYYGKGDHVCDITGKDVVYELSLEKRLDDCPFVEIPQHGRLIDADALVLNAWYTNGGWKTLANLIPIERVTTAPTIIPADKEGDG